VQVVPHITDEIKSAIRRLAPDHDVVLTEIGGTVGDIESFAVPRGGAAVPQDVGRDNVLFVHVTLVPMISATNELKTKPTQHSSVRLMEIGIQARYPGMPHGASPVGVHQAEDACVLTTGGLGLL